MKLKTSKSWRRFAKRVLAAKGDFFPQKETGRRWGPAGSNWPGLTKNLPSLGHNLLTANMTEVFLLYDQVAPALV